MSEFLPAELHELGLTPFFLQQVHGLVAEHGVDLSKSVVGRIACERRGEYEVSSAQITLRASLSGRLEHQLGDDDRPAVGDWVLVEPADPVGRVEHVLERQAVLRRVGVDGTSHAQTLAANVDLCCIVCALTAEDADVHARKRALNPRRIERYLRTAHGSNVPALVVVNKADLLPLELARERVAELQRELPDARAVLVSAQTHAGLEALWRELLPGTSAVLLGSSGVGKSTLVNALLGEAAQKIGAERSDDTRGRHTTTERQLLRLQNGALLIDTPGMRELALWADADTDASSGFGDIDALAQACHFRDCRHQGEPGCAVAAAIEAGTLTQQRLDHAHKLERELLHQRARVDVRLRTAQHNASKALSRASRKRMKEQGKI
jgi:ribosome biogenesis GTPase / thiamine phosphate phosphatase